MISLNLTLGTSNINKQREFKEILTPLGINLLPPPDIEVEETGNTFKDNAILKARTISKYTNTISVSEDAGLVVPILNGFPGIYSARFSNCKISGRGRSLTILSHEIREDRDLLTGDALVEENNRLLLENMSEFSGLDRAAYFYAYLAVCNPKGEVLFTAEGSSYGVIGNEVKKGLNGFAYDHLFIGDNCNGRYYSELSSEEKNALSHRGQALRKFSDWINLEGIGSFKHF